VSLAVAAPTSVCAAPSSDPHCTVDPGTVPKAMDVITPAGVSQADELD
jgi:glucoamylase